MTDAVLFFHFVKRSCFSTMYLVTQSFITGVV